MGAAFTNSDKKGSPKKIQIKINRVFPVIDFITL
jgi:hypothetical protein